jgi:hypothetical protein
MLYSFIPPNAAGVTLLTACILGKLKKQDIEKIKEKIYGCAVTTRKH